MSRTKVWTRQQRESRKEARAAEQEAAQRRRQRRRHLAVWLAATVATAALFVFVGVQASDSRSRATVGMSALSGVVLVASIAAHRALSRLVGSKTSIVLMSLVGGVLFLALAASASQCPDSAAVGRCTTGELANWGMVGMLFPLTGAVMIGAPVVIAKFGGRLFKVLVRLWKGEPLNVVSLVAPGRAQQTEADVANKSKKRGETTSRAASRAASRAGKNARGADRSRNAAKPPA